MQRDKWLTTDEEMTEQGLNVVLNAPARTK
jgi:hypothetical protein